MSLSLFNPLLSFPLQFPFEFLHTESGSISSALLTAPLHRDLVSAFHHFDAAAFFCKPPSTLFVFLSPQALVFSSVHSASAIFVPFRSNIPILLLE